MHLPRRSPILPLAILCGALLATAAAGHNLSFTETLVLFRSDGTFQVDMSCDLDALALGVSPTADSAEVAARLRGLELAELDRRIGALRRYFERRVRLIFDDESLRGATITFPEYGTPLADESEVPTVLGLTARFEGRIPPGTTTFQLRASRSFPPVHLTVLHQQQASYREILEKGVPSAAFQIDQLAAPSVDRSDVAARYLVLGFWHIVPEGLDHILFVLGLFLLSTHWRPLLWQVSAFTAAHTVTLALSTYGLFDLPSSVVEPLIALSIAYVAIENVVTTELKPWRPWVVFAFGLLHGLGFAGVLGELGLPRGELLPALLAFNVGVELGQLTVIVVAFAALGYWCRESWYHRRVIVPISVLIAAIGLYWAMERTFF